ncbi:hypothetical protein JVU11DRAFT_8884 [Chiua virens]|nr:hypothetical protein JVU11DRAFT_8884 [Chiua virens]
MDVIHESLTTKSHDATLSPAVCTALQLAKKTLNHYYKLTNGSVSYILITSYNTSNLLIGSLPEWIKTAKTLVCEEFNCMYITHKCMNMNGEQTSGSARSFTALGHTKQGLQVLKDQI